MDHYRTYLRGELARLSSRSVATDLVSTRACATAGLPAGPAPALVARFATQPRTDAYVETRADEQLVRLTECLSEWRNNNVRFELSPSQRTEFRSVVVGAISLNDAEPWLHDRFEQNVRQLTRIGLDPEVLSDPAYLHHRPGETVAFPICLAKPDSDGRGMFRVIDGVHRAIQLFRNGEPAITLCVFQPR